MIFEMFILSLLIVAFGQPSTSLLCSLLAATCGYALFWNSLLDYSPKKRFWLASGWFSAVQLIQLFWLTSHPFYYIYGLYLFLALGVGLQFGLVAYLLNRERLNSLPQLLALTGLWTLLEWGRLFFLSGFSFNPVGLALSANLYSLQMASLWGLYGLSFWVIFVNLLALRVYLYRSGALLFLSAAALPYLYGLAQLNMPKPLTGHYSALLIQTAFPSEETMVFHSLGERVAYVIDEWKQILKLAKKEHGKPVDLIALPEFVVPYGTYTPLFPHKEAVQVFTSIYGQEVAALLPALEAPLAEQIENVWFVNNAYWLQGLANVFQAEAISGLEDAEEIAPGNIAYYSAAIHVRPNLFHPQRYEKRILMPMGEYIPFEFCRSLAASYGIGGSFTPGKEAKIFKGKQPLGPCICYEETYGNLMRENSQKGARLLVNLTNDGWYPHSRLPKVHLDHARLRTVENGLPLLRACNTGVTAAFDSHGRLVAELDNRKEAAGALHVTVPLTTYSTLYSRVGDALIVILSGFCLILFLPKSHHLP